jgi:hypothetical protein
LFAIAKALRILRIIQNRNAIEMQRFLRGCIGRLKFKIFKEKTTRKKREQNASLLIQKLYRGYKGREAFLIEKELRKMEEKAKPLLIHFKKLKEEHVKLTARIKRLEEEVEKFRGQSASVLHPELTPDIRTVLTLDLLSSAYAISEKIRLAPGRFTVTSTEQKLPITLVNDFPNPAKISIRVEAFIAEENTEVDQTKRAS